MVLFLTDSYLPIFCGSVPIIGSEQIHLLPRDDIIPSKTSGSSAYDIRQVVFPEYTQIKTNCFENFFLNASTHCL